MAPILLHRSDGAPLATSIDDDWVGRNQASLMREVERIRRRLAGEIHDELTGPCDAAPADSDSVLESMATAFGLSPFERDVLLLAAGVELSTNVSLACSGAQKGAGGAGEGPTFGLALAILEHPHWTALTPGAPLRHWRLITLDEGPVLTSRRLRIDEWTLHALAGAPALDERLLERAETVPTRRSGLAPGQRRLASEAARALRRSARAGAAGMIRLWGDDETTVRAVVGFIGQRMDRPVYRMPAAAIPHAPEECVGLARLWDRENRLAPLVLMVDSSDVDQHGTGSAAEEFLCRVQVPIVVASRRERRIAGRAAPGFEVAPPTSDERAALWQTALGDHVRVGPLAAQFGLNARSIAEVAARVAAAPGDDPARTAWAACRTQARPSFQGLAERIEARATRDALVVTPETRRVLDEIVVHVRHRHTVEQVWGFARQGGRNLGLTALFHGPTGTGKTLAAETVAAELALDLYRVDLSRVVNKYIGETEKNLARIFEAARSGGAVLLFDEADALFGKRSEVKQSHDRYANVEIAYLLQAMEEYPGLAVLTTNHKDALDPAFLRRLRFVAAFSAPDVSQRREIWRRIFPPEAPTGDIELDRLAQLNLSGGSIRNIAVAAAMLAADAGVPIGMSQITRAARVEAAKLGRPLTRAELEGWPTDEETG